MGGCASSSGRLHNHQGKNLQDESFKRAPAALRGGGERQEGK